MSAARCWPVMAPSISSVLWHLQLSFLVCVCSTRRWQCVHKPLALRSRARVHECVLACSAARVDRKLVNGAPCNINVQ